MTGAREMRVKTKAIAPKAHKRPFRRVTTLLLVVVVVLLMLSLFMDTPATKVA
jgi:cell division septal protein FtsQ